jgi:hypothetical protein
MPKSKSRKKKPPHRVLALPDLEHATTAVLNSLTSASGQQRRLRLVRIRSGGSDERLPWRLGLPDLHPSG